MAAPRKLIAPTAAPTQPHPVTGKGTVAPTQATFQPPGGLAPKPPSAGTTGPTIAKPSVDYHSQQGSRVPADISRPHDNANTYANTSLLDQQSQQAQGKGGG